MAKPRSSIRSFGNSTTSSTIWTARPRNRSHNNRKCSRPSRSKLPFVATITMIASAIVATKKITHTTVLTATVGSQVSSRACTSCGRRAKAP